MRRFSGSPVVAVADSVSVQWPPSSLKLSQTDRSISKRRLGDRTFQGRLRWTRCRWGYCRDIDAADRQFVGQPAMRGRVRRRALSRRQTAPRRSLPRRPIRQPADRLIPASWLLRRTPTWRRCTPPAAHFGPCNQPYRTPSLRRRIRLYVSSRTRRPRNTGLAPQPLEWIDWSKPFRYSPSNRLRAGR